VLFANLRKVKAKPTFLFTGLGMAMRSFFAEPTQRSGLGDCCRGISMRYFALSQK